MPTHDPGLGAATSVDFTTALAHIQACAAWARHDGFGSRACSGRLVGAVTFAYESMELVADPGLTMFVYTVEPGLTSAQALNLLASWTATLDERTADAGDPEPRRDSAAPTLGD